MFPRTRQSFVAALAAIFMVLTTTLVVLQPAAPAEAGTIPSGFPNGNNTGLTNPGALKVHNGNLTVTKDGTVIQNLEIRGRVEIYAKNVVMRNVWVYTPDFWTILVRPGGSLLIEDSEIGHPSFPGERGLGGNNVTARRVDVHSVEDGFKAGDNSLYDFVYCHDLKSPRSGPHGDCFQDDGGATDFIIRNSTLDARWPNGSNANAAIILKSDLGPINNVLVEDNYLNGGALIVMVDKGTSFPAPTNIVIRGNAFGPDYEFKPGTLLRHPAAGITWQGNYWAGSGQFIDEAGRPVGGTVTRFADVSSRHVFVNDIEWLADEGITKGCNPPLNSRFCPYQNVTRGQMAAFLSRALNLPASSKDYFSDDNGSTFENDINRVAKAGITSGCNPPKNNHFCPDKRVNRGQMAVFIVRAKGYTNNGGGDRFIDDNGTVYEESIDRLATAGVTKGCNPPTNNRFCPGDAVTRGQMAAFFHRAFG